MQISESVYLHYLSALLDGDKPTCRDIISGLINDKVDTKEIYEKFIQKSMYRVGELWDKCRLTIAEEHRASEITREILAFINVSRSKQISTNKSIVITCVQKELHELGPRIISDYFELKGWNSTYLGTNLPDKELLKFIKQRKPDLVGISNNFYMNVTKLLELLDRIKSTFPEQKIIIGGQGPSNCHLEMISKYPEITYINNLTVLDNYLIELENRY